MTTYLALYMGTPGVTPAQPDQATIAKGMAAWGQWMDDHADVIVDAGGPLGKTKKADKAGVSDMTNAVAGYVIVAADSHEAAVRLFENHPHFAIFPGASVEVMEVMAIPGG